MVVISKVSPAHISILGTNEIFVFGSNRAGNHGRGAAQDALKFGAEMGLGHGPAGKTYAIATKDHKLRPLPLSEIQQAVDVLGLYIDGRPDLQFMITKIGCGLAGYTPEQIAPMFKFYLGLPNAHLPEEFMEVLLRGINS